MGCLQRTSVQLNSAQYQDITFLLALPLPLSSEHDRSKFTARDIMITSNNVLRM